MLVIEDVFHIVQTKIQVKEFLRTMQTILQKAVLSLAQLTFMEIFKEDMECVLMYAQIQIRQRQEFNLVIMYRRHVLRSALQLLIVLLEMYYL